MDEQVAMAPDICKGSRGIMLVLFAGDSDPVGVQSLALPSLGMSAHEPHAEERYSAITVCGQNSRFQPKLHSMLSVVDSPGSAVGYKILLVQFLVIFCLHPYSRTHGCIADLIWFLQSGVQ